MNFQFFMYFCALLSTSYAVFNFDELDKTNYGVEIMDKPIVMSNDDSPTQLLMMSIHGQQYQCNYPDVITNDKIMKEEEQEALELGVSELLKPMADGPCLVLSKGWWTYEFCFGKEIKQYHLQDGQVAGVVTSLGSYDSEFDWNDDKQELEKKRRILNRYHSQQYVNGSLCDLTNKHRNTEVRFQCEAGKGDHIYRIDEPQTCTYQIIVNTMKICHHPFLKPPAPKLPTPISCNPVLTSEEFNEYLQDLKQQEEEKLKNKDELLKKSTEEYLSKLKAKHDKEEFILKDGRLVQIDHTKKLETETTGISTKDAEEIEDSDWSDLTDESKLTESLTDLDKAFTEALSKTMRDIFGDEKDNEGKMKFKVFKDVEDLKQSFKKFKVDDIKTKTTSGDKSKDLDDLDEADVEKDYEDDDLDDEDIEVKDITDEELKEMVDEYEPGEDDFVDEEYGNESQDTVKDDPTSQAGEEDLEGESFIREDELNDNFDEDDDFDLDDNIGNANFGRLAHHMSNLNLKEKDKRGEETDQHKVSQEEAAVNKELKSLDDVARNIGKLRRASDMKNTGTKLHGSGVLQDKKDQADDTTSDNFNENLLKEYEKELDSIAPTKEAKAKLSKYTDAIRKSLGAKFNDILKEAKAELGDEHDEALETDESKEETETEMSATLHQLLDKLEKAEKDLEKANDDLKEATDKKEVSTSLSTKEADDSNQLKINVNGQTMSVIIKAGYYDEDDDSIHFFKDDEADGVTNVMYALMGDSPLQRKEESRHENMEKGYNFKFNKKSEDINKQDSLSDDES